ncbi:hypothetical protein Dimus_012633, partial [Dionaea muscipula]
MTEPPPAAALLLFLANHREVVWLVWPCKAAGLSLAGHSDRADCQHRSWRPVSSPWRSSSPSTGYPRRAWAQHRGGSMAGHRGRQEPP